MSIREELRVCAATRRVDVWGNGLSLQAFYVAQAFIELTEGTLNTLAIKDRATFLLLVAEAL